MSLSSALGEESKQMRTACQNPHIERNSRTEASVKLVCWQNLVSQIQRLQKYAQTKAHLTKPKPRIIQAVTTHLIPAACQLPRICESSSAHPAMLFSSLS